MQIHAATRHEHRQNRAEQPQTRTGSHLPPDTRPAASPYAAKPIPSPVGNQAQPGPKPAHPRTPDGRFAPEFIAHPVAYQPS